MAGGRPKIFTQAAADEICKQISISSKSLRTICNDEKLPCVSTVLNWLNSNTEFLAQYTRAKEMQADFLADEMMEIADDSNGDLAGVDKYGNPIENKEFINRSRLRVDTRKWIASKLKPKKYADRVDLTTNGKDLPGNNIINLPTDALKQLEQIIANATTTTTTTNNQTDATGNSEGTV